MTASENTTLPPPADVPAPAPRALTGHNRYRALAAKPVSMLLLICLIIVVGSVYTMVDDLSDWARISRLKSIGQSTTAQVTDVSRRRPGGERGAFAEYVTYEFRTSPDAEPITGESLSSQFAHLDKRIRLGSTVTVRYDPADPQDFFCVESDDHTLGSRLAVQIMFLTIAGLLLILAVYRYFRLLKIVRDAPAQIGTVAQISASGQGAFSRLVVVTFQHAGRNFVIKRIAPMRLAHTFSSGQSVWLLVPPRKPNRAIIAGAFL